MSPIRPFRLAVAVILSLLVSMEARAVRAADDVRESWDAVYIQGKRVGYFHTQVQPLKYQGRDYLRVQIDMSLTVQRLGDPLTIETLYGTIENPDGGVLKLDSRTLMSKQETRVSGTVADGKMKLTFEGTGQSQEKTIDWGTDVRGPYGVEMSLVRQPIKPGETREVKVFIPDLNDIGISKVKALPVETVALGGNVKRQLMRVEQNMFDSKGSPIPGMATTNWVDSGGQILRTSNEVFGGMETYRTTKEAATRGIQGTKLDLTASTMIKVRKRITEPVRTRDVVFELTTRGDELITLFPNDRRQTLTPGATPGTGKMEVKTAGPLDGQPATEPASDKYLKPNTMINSNDKLVIAHASDATKGLTDQWQKATAIQHWVFEHVKKKDFSTAFAAANEVARDLTGDCTEHSVLTAAMCRAVGIPSRVVVGLIYVEHLKGFGFHMWNEVYVNQRWVAIDAAWDQNDVDAVHIKMGDSGLDGVSPYESFLSVVKVLDKVTIEPVEIR
jgi:hypothetical protein